MCTKARIKFERKELSIIGLSPPKWTRGKKMKKNGTLLVYENEEQYLNSTVKEILNRICKEKGKLYEADSWDDFLNGNLIAKDRIEFSTWTEKEDAVDTYFEFIVKQVEQMTQKNTSEEAGRVQLEEWLTVKSCKINDHNTYIMAPCHPAVYLVDQYNQSLRDKFNIAAAEWNNLVWKISQAVLQDYLRNNENFYVYSTGQVYFSVRRDGCRQAIPWKDVGTLTAISSTRLIEKTRSWIVRNCSAVNAQVPVNIAYIGMITDEEVISEYFRENPIILENGEMVCPQVTLSQLKQMPHREKYIFERQGIADGSKRIYNLTSLADMKELFANFQIVLFLDESYFYRQRQSAKNLMEKGVADYVQWCQKELDKKLKSKISDEEKELKKNYFYSQIYNKAGLWLNGYGKGDTSKLGFDSSLFSTIRQAYNPKCDVYLYISRGKAIGDIRLPVQSICNDERYDGKRMLVYRVTGQDDAAGNNDVSDSVGEMLQDTPILASIDLWKLVKSVGRDFRTGLFYDQGSSPEEISKQITLLKKTLLYITVKKEDKKKPVLQFHMYCQKPADEQRGFLKEFVQSYLKICVEGHDFPYVQNYLYDLLVASFIARANSARGIFYAYLLKKRNLVDLDVTVIEDFVSPGPEMNKMLFRARRTIYSAIRGLDQIMVRDMEKRLSILKYEFRFKYCPDINEEKFLLLLDKINGYCAETGYTDNRLYLLTKKEERD